MRWAALLLLAACNTGLQPATKADDDTDVTTPIDSEPDTSGTWETDAPPTDRDGDGVPDDDDLCPDVADDQADLDGDRVGDACDPDRDGDQVPDEVDRWPDDGTFPALASGERIYPHTATHLYVLQLAGGTERIDEIGRFTYDVPVPATRNAHEMTDMAIDRAGLLYGITFDEVFVCHPGTAACRRIGRLPASSNGLTFVPQASGDALVGMGEDRWFELDLSSSVVITRPRGTFEPGCSGTCAKASGDAFSIEGVGTFATVYGYQGYTLRDQLVELDPATGAITREILRFVGARNDSGSGAFQDVWGLAGWTDGYFYGFVETGEVLKIDVAAGRFSVLFQTGLPWWGAGVRTIVPPAP
ncbi:MAG: thrombospondin type 3 repeat-containing protein [Alphaproteobacteria bacterium]|nr:thrombospondin type 3 repeat-containing protein [Alphaproteobacteria bacterium]